MADPILSALRRSWRGLYARGVELLTADQVTRLSWARRVESYADVPEVYRDALNAVLPRSQAFPGGILTPTFKGFLREENERLVMRLEDCIHILERQNLSIAATTFHLDEIDYVEQAAILLRAWLTLSGRDTTGELRQVTLRYNSVTERLFYPLVDAVRRVSTPLAAGFLGLTPETRAAIDGLEVHSFKFRNFARRSLLPGEQIEVCIFQPEIRIPRLEAFGRVWLRRRLSSAHLCLLTGSELILIGDDPDIPRGIQQQPYGGIWTFIPRRWITSTVLETGPGDSLRLRVTLRGGSMVESLFTAAQRGRLEQLVPI